MDSLDKSDSEGLSLNNVVVAPCTFGSIFFAFIWDQFASFQLNFRSFPDAICTILAILGSNLCHFGPIFGPDLYQFTQQNLYPWHRGVMING